MTFTDEKNCYVFRVYIYEICCILFQVYIYISYSNYSQNAFVPGNQKAYLNA